MDSQYNKLVNIIKQKISKFNDKRFFVIGIDGNCGSGKTTLATKLSDDLCCDVVHIDDFFLPMELRNDVRLREIAGNFHYERFKDEVINNLNDSKFNYRIFDCKSMDYIAEKVVNPNNVLIIEGSYSFSHDFYKSYDYKIFTECGYDVQLKRISNRVGENKLEKFKSQWIPMENNYFTKYKTSIKADSLYKT